MSGCHGVKSRPASVGERLEEQGKRSDNGRRAILQPARRTATNQVAHDEPEIEGARMNQHALENVRVAAQMGAAHAAGVIEMGEGPFDPLAALAHQAAAAPAANPPPIGIHQGPGCGLL